MEQNHMKCNEQRELKEQKEPHLISKDYLYRQKVLGVHEERAVDFSQGSYAQVTYQITREEL
jgi:hypothetical protein